MGILYKRDGFIPVSSRAGLMLSVPLWCGLIATEAKAACTPSPAASGNTVTCTGAGLPAFIAGTGVTGLTVNIATGASITGVTQTVTGANGQFSSLLVNDSSTINNAGSISPGAPIVGSAARDYVGVNLNGSDTNLVNTGTITIQNAANSATYRLYGVISSAPSGGEFDDVSIVNRGTISANQSSTNRAYAIYSGESIDTFSINNYGTISVVRTAGTTNLVGAIGADDDTDTMNIRNRAGATISSTGPVGSNTFAIGGQAGDYEIINEGTVTATNGAGAIVIWGGGDDGASANIDNRATGVINGNIYLTERNPVTLGTAPAFTRDSTFTNEGTVNGSFFYGMGTHVLTNTGTVNGSINVDQTNYGATAGTPSFTLSNSGILTGNIAITDRAGAQNSISLTGTGFSGSITAVNGTGSNALTLTGVTNLAGVTNFSSVNFTTSRVAVAGGVSVVNGARLGTTIFGAGGTPAAPSNNLGSMTGTLTLQGTSTITPTLAGIVRNGDVYRLASSVAGATNGITVQNTSALVTLRADASSGQLLLVSSVANPAAIPGISQAGGATLNNLLSYSGTNARLQALGGAVESLSSLNAVRVAAEQLRPDLSGASVQVPLDTNYTFQSQIGSRLDSLFYGALAAQQGRSADYHPQRVEPVFLDPANGVWMNGFGGRIEQRTDAAVAGYHANTGGVIGGYDRLFQNTFRLGGAFGYATSEIDNTMLLGNHQSQQTYEGLVYGQLVMPRWYLNGSFGVGDLNFYSTRSINFAGFSDTATTSHSGMIYSGRADAGYPIVTGFGIFVPVASVTYAHVDQNAYTESSAAGAGLSVAKQSTDSVRSGLGAKAIFPVYSTPTLAASIETRAIWLHEFENTGQTIAAGFVGGSGSFITVGPSPTRDMADVGAAMRFVLPNIGDSFSIGYNAIVRDRHFEQVGMLRARVDF